MRRLLLVVSLCVLAAGACSNDKASEPSAPRAVPSTLLGKLIGTDDLPSGFTRVSAEERDPNEAPSEYCAELDAHRKSFPGQRIAEAQFRRRTGTAAAYVNEQITRYADTAEAARAFADFEKALDQCALVTKKNDTSSLSGSFDPVEFVQIGDESYATSFSATQTVNEDTASISGYFVTWRARRYVVLLSMLGSVDPPDKTDVESVARRAVKRI